MKDNKIFIWGGGGHAKVILDMIRLTEGPLTKIVIFDDDPAKKGIDFYGIKIFGSIEEYSESITRLIIAIGNNQIRKEKAESCKHQVQSFLVLADSSVTRSPSASIAGGTVLMPGVKVNADARVGQHCILNTGSIIEHDCIIGDYTHIAPGTVLTGMVSVGSMTLIGANSTIVPGISVGNNCLISAGSVVTRNIPDNAIARGNPTRVIKIKYPSL